MPRVPRVANFIWYGDEMPWIRRLSIESFKRLNPGWTVRVLGGKSGWTKKRRVNESDILRYAHLAEHGGFYFDTDIIFTRPMDAFMERIKGNDTGVCFELSGPTLVWSLDGRCVEARGIPEWYSIASLFAAPDNAFFRAVHESSMDDESFKEQDAQYYGVTAFARMYDTITDAEEAFPGLSFYNIQRKSFLPVGYKDTRKLFRNSPMFYGDLMSDEDVFGVHWYGGATTAKIAEEWTHETYWRDSVLGMLVAPCVSESETLLEQHGVG